MAIFNYIKSLFKKGTLALCFSAIVMPTTGSVSSYFGMRNDPITKRYKFHTGIDLASGYATSIKAVEEGEVEFAGKRRGYGNLVVLNHRNGIETFYGHLGRIFVQAGEKISRGQTVGWMGLTGRSTGTHLHYEVRKNGVSTDPLRFTFAPSFPINEPEKNLLWAILFGNVKDFFELPKNIF